MSKVVILFINYLMSLLKRIKQSLLFRMTL